METAVKHEVMEIIWPQKTFLTKRAVIGFDKLSTFFTEAYGAIYQALKSTGTEAREMPFGIYFSVDEIKKETDVAAAVPVPETINEMEGFELVTIPESKALLVTYYGSYENMRPAYEALDKYVADHKFQTQWMLEEYFSDPAVEKDSSTWKTNIYFIVK